MTRRRTSRWFPELSRAGPRPKRLELWRAAYHPVLKSPTYWLIALGTQLAGQLLCGFLGSQAVRQFGSYGGLFRWTPPAFGAFAASILTLWFVRKRINRNVRRELNRRGMPTCLGCGYDLTGNVSGVCPECGRRIS